MSPSLCYIKQSDFFVLLQMCLNSWIPLVRSTCELIFHQQKHKTSKRDQTVTKREFTRHRELRTENVRDSAHSPLRSGHFSVQISRQLSFRPSIAQPFMCASNVSHFVIRSALFEFVFTQASVLHEHVLQHYMFHPSRTSFGCPCLRRLAVNMVHECHFVSQFFQEMFCHHPFGNPSCQSA